MSPAKVYETDHWVLQSANGKNALTYYGKKAASPLTDDEVSQLLDVLKRWNDDRA